MSWFQKLLPPKIKRKESGEKKAVPEGLWSKCASCDAVLYYSDLGNNLNVCPKCNHHNRISARVRLDLFLDAEGRYEIGPEVQSLDPLKFKDSKRYIDRLAEAKKETDEDDALVVMQGSVESRTSGRGSVRVRFHGRLDGLGGRRALRTRRAGVRGTTFAFCVFRRQRRRAHAGRACCRLMQMAKTTAALTQLSEERLPFISVLTDPTMGGVSASFAFIGDVVIAEPGALIGFAGPRVIEQTVRQTLPEGFQRAEFLLEHGAIDMIVDRRRMRDKVANLCTLLMRAPPPS